MLQNVTWTSRAVGSFGAAILALGLTQGQTQVSAAGKPVTILAVDPNMQGDGTMGPAAAARLRYGPLPFSQADVAAKAAADRDHAAAVRSGALRPTTSSPRATIIGSHNFAGLAADTPDTSSVPPDNEGAIGPKSYIETINSAVAIYNRTTNAVIATGSLNDLNGFGPGAVNSFDPQIIWDPTTNRFYYSMDSIVSETANLLTLGFSKSASPLTVTSADWCQYQLNYGTPFPDFPKMGDSKFFFIIGVNVFNPGFVGSDLIAISKPAGTAAITTCPDASSFKVGIAENLKNTTGAQVFTPVPSNQIDANNTGYVVARNGGLPATKLWFFNVTKALDGTPVFGSARGVTVPSYTVPPNATQPTFGQLLDTSDARNTQAVQAINPDRGTIHSFWTQHTIASSSVSGVRWYEINPAPAIPVVLRTGIISATNTFNFNGAISPDRKVKGASKAFGDSFVIQYNASGGLSGISPRIEARSSFNGAAVSASVVVKAGVGPYRAFDCPSSGDVCRWGDYAALTPDPNSVTTGTRGSVWGVNQFSGVVNPPGNDANWRTQIFGLRP